MFRELGHGPLNEVLQVPLAEEVVGPMAVVLELQRPMIGLPVFLDGLKEDQGIAASIAKLVLG
jgi:hypothetical protein